MGNYKVGDEVVVVLGKGITRVGVVSHIAPDRYIRVNFTEQAIFIDPKTSDIYEVKPGALLVYRGFQPFITQAHTYALEKDIYPNTELARLIYG